MPMTDEKFVELLGRLDERTERMDSRIERLEHVLLDGNGTPPLTVTVARLGERVGVLETHRAERYPRWGILLTVLSLFVAVMAVVIGTRGL